MRRFPRAYRLPSLLRRSLFTFKPVCPDPGYIWIPGYSGLGPGLWLLLGAGHLGAGSRPGWLWTPGYWGGTTECISGTKGTGGRRSVSTAVSTMALDTTDTATMADTGITGIFHYNRTVNNIRTTNITNLLQQACPRSATTKPSKFQRRTRRHCTSPHCRTVGCPA